MNLYLFIKGNFSKEFIREATSYHDIVGNLEYENILQKVDCRVTAPYWDWSLDSESPFTSDVWSTDLCKYDGFGSNVTPITTGPFAYHDWQLTPSAIKEPCLRYHFNGD